MLYIHVHIYKFKLPFMNHECYTTIYLNCISKCVCQTFPVWETQTNSFLSCYTIFSHSRLDLNLSVLCSLEFPPLGCFPETSYAHKVGLTTSDMLCVHIVSCPVCVI